MSEAKPFLKYVGGKTSLLPEILRRLPPAINTYHEPFVGGGAVFFALSAENRFKSAVLCDTNAELVKTYDGIKSHLRDTIELLKDCAAEHAKRSSQWYYEMRGRSVPVHPAECAARMIYLNRTCFNGLYRVNKRGEFNVPVGSYKNPTICNEENLSLVSRSLQEVNLIANDFSWIKPKKGDAVYFDCPYFPLSATSNFTAYSQDGFTWRDQERLRDFARHLIDRGIYVLLSNSDTPFTRELYKGFKIETVEAPRRVNSKASGREKVTELLISGRGR